VLAALAVPGGLFENFFSILHSHNSAPELLTQVTVTTPVSQVGVVTRQPAE
jgi:hypothetical protein